MLRRFFGDGAQELGAHGVLAQAAERIFLTAVQAGLELAVRRETEPVAGRAEVPAYGADQTDAALRVRETVERGDAASGAAG